MAKKKPAQATLVDMDGKRIKTLEPYSKGWERQANLQAREYIDMIPCGHCGYPRPASYKCERCGYE